MSGGTRSFPTFPLRAADGNAGRCRTARGWLSGSSWLEVAQQDVPGGHWHQLPVCRQAQYLEDDASTWQGCFRDPTCTNTAQTAGAARARALNGPGTASLPREQMRTGGGENSKHHPCARGRSCAHLGFLPPREAEQPPPTPSLQMAPSQSE